MTCSDRLISAILFGTTTTRLCGSWAGMVARPDTKGDMEAVLLMKTPLEANGRRKLGDLVSSC